MMESASEQRPLRAHYISARGTGRRGSRRDDAARRADVDPRTLDAVEHDVPVELGGERVTRCGMGVVGRACLTRLR